MKHRDNYEYMKEQMQRKFLEYGQERMIRKFRLRHDAQYLYLECLEREYRISRTTGVVEWTEDGFASCETIPNLCKPPMWCRIEAPHWR